jgi:hypothetical protein
MTDFQQSGLYYIKLPVLTVSRDKAPCPATAFPSHSRTLVKFPHLEYERLQTESSFSTVDIKYRRQFFCQDEAIGCSPVYELGGR